MRLPMGYFDTKMTGDILQRINDHTRIQNFLTGSSLSVVFSTFNIVVFGVVLLLYSPLVFSSSWQAARFTWPTCGCS